MIYGRQFSRLDLNNDSIVDTLWCQSANNGSNIGLWYYPNGTQVPLFNGTLNINNINDSAQSPLFSKRFTGQIVLARNENLMDYEGLYTCIIPDENGVNQTLVVGVYSNNGYSING